MTALFECALTNAALAAPLALLAALSTFARRPALTHVLWLLVLLRLFAPVVWRVPVPVWPAAQAEVAAARTVAAASQR